MIRTCGDALVIAGGSDRAVLFGVYDFLERVGCRWYGPREEYVPQMKTLEIPTLNVAERPGLRWRALELIVGSTPAVVDWMAKAKLNVAWPEMYVPNKDMTVNEESQKRAAVPEMVGRGMTLFWGGHVLTLLFPPEKYEKEHPEYFALIHGKRLDPAVDPAARYQLCTGNPEVLRILTENAIAFLRYHPWIEVLFLWGQDTVQWCECDRCQALEPAPEKRTGPQPNAPPRPLGHLLPDGQNRQ